MPNLRIIYDNAADRAALTASTSAGSLVATNLQTSIKGDVWRSTATSATITATWAASETIGGVALPFCNLTAAATIRVRGYAQTADATPLFDTGTVNTGAVPAPGVTVGVNAFPRGGYVYGRAWIAVPGAVKKLVIDIADPTNAAGYVEAGALVCGAYWSPENNADYGAPITPMDTSKHYRNAAGDLLTDIGTRHRKQSISLSALSLTDRAKLWDILWGNGMARPVLLSLYPNHGDTKLEHTHQIFGKLATTAAMSTPYYQRHAGSLDIEEV